MSMDIQALLTGIDCACGRRHTCEMKHVIIRSGAIDELPQWISDYHHIVVVADNNTFPLCGEKAIASLAGKVAHTLIIRRNGALVPDEAAVAEITSALTDGTDLLIGIGSGVIQDLCKYVSFRQGIDYAIVATAPSMDGYASVGAAMIMDHMKVTYTAHVPVTIICDTDILKNAPLEMIKAGYGDILGKFSCLNDWKLSHLVNGEYYCPFVAELTEQMLMQVKDLGPRLLARDPEAIELLMEALIGVGIAMSYVGNSRPASGSEHHLAHYFEIVGLVKQQPYFMHGIDVVCGSVYTQRLREALLALNAPPAASRHAREQWESEIRRIYGSATEGVLALQNRLGLYDINRNSIYAAKWQEIKALLAETPSSQEMCAYLASAGLDIREFENEYGTDKIRDALLYAKDLKDRYSVLWLYYDCML